MSGLVLQGAVLVPHRVESPTGGPRRQPPRPIERREADYNERYDDSTIFYDVFRAGRRIVAIGPPAGSLADYARNLRIPDSTGRSTGFRVESGLDRLGRFWATTDSGARVPSRAGEYPDVVVGSDLSGRFAGRRAVVTLSKDNDLTWIADWGRWYAQRHGADALVVYDNGSRSYSLEELAATLRAVPGIVESLVVDWSFPYGPIGEFPDIIFDSNYAQHGALEHARWRILRAAAGYLSVDIDELVIDPDGRSVFDAISSSPSGVLSIEGRWIYPDPATPLTRQPRHADSSWVKVRPPDAPSPRKWGIVPARLPRRAQLMVHDVMGVGESQDSRFWFAHLLSISTNWAGGRGASAADPNTHVEVTELRQRYSPTFRQTEPQTGVKPRLRDRSSYLPRRVIWFGRRLRHRLATASRSRETVG